MLLHLWKVDTIPKGPVRDLLSVVARKYAETLTHNQHHTRYLVAPDMLNYCSIASPLTVLEANITVFEAQSQATWLRLSLWFSSLRAISWGFYAFLDLQRCQTKVGQAVIWLTSRLTMALIRLFSCIFQSVVRGEVLAFRAHRTCSLDPANANDISQSIFNTSEHILASLQPRTNLICKQTKPTDLSGNPSDLHSAECVEQSLAL